MKVAAINLCLAGVMALTLIIVWGLFFLGRVYIRRGEAPPDQSASVSWPPVAVIIPVAGWYPGLAGNLQSRLTQDYPRYQVIFVTRGEADPATPVIQTLLPDFPRASLRHSGPAAACGQKNHNLLAGVRAAGPEAEILVFADANQQAPAHWLRNLVRPLASGEAVVASSFHHISPQDQRLGTLGRSLTVLLIYLGKGVSGWDQPWGGSTAIRRQVFQALGVEQVWARTVVDDVTLARRLKQAGIRLAAAPGAVLATPAAESLASWASWFSRQLLYLKFYFPGSWLLAGAGIFLLLGLVLAGLGQVLSAAVTGPSWVRLGPGGIFLLAWLGFLLSLRSLHPSPGPWGRYLAAAFLALGLAAWCHAKTWGQRQLLWRNLLYTVDHQGFVTGIQELG